MRLVRGAAAAVRRRCRAPILATAPSANAPKGGLSRDSDTPNQEHSLSQKPVMSAKTQGSREHESVAQEKAPTRPTYRSFAADRSEAPLWLYLLTIPAHETRVDRAENNVDPPDEKP